MVGGTEFEELPERQRNVQEVLKNIESNENNNFGGGYDVDEFTDEW